MRIVNKKNLMRQAAKTAFLIALGFTVATHDARAQDALAAPPPPSALPQAMPTPMPGAVAPGGDLGKTVSAMEEKTADSAHGAIKHLDGAPDGLTFEDLNSARQTMARIDAMIEIEKRMTELDKLRNDRGGSGSFANVIPASALRPPAGGGAVAAAPAVSPMPVAMPEMHPHISMPATEVARISGVEGRYSATLKLADGTTHTVRVGDQLPSGGTVQWISASAVGIEDKGETRILRIKNVDAVYSVMR